MEFPSLSLFLDPLFTAAPVHIKPKVIPVVAGRERDGLAQGEADSVDDSLTARLVLGAQAGGRSTAAVSQELGGVGEVQRLSVVKYSFPDGMAVLIWDLEADQIIHGKMLDLVNIHQPLGGEILQT